jgi:hypothetical protein
VSVPVAVGANASVSVKTLKPFVAACDKFIYIENLTYTDNDEASTPAEQAPKPAHRATGTQLKGDTALVNLLRTAVEAASDDDGWAQLAGVGQIITKQRPDFDSRTYGYARLSDLIEATGLFELERRSLGNSRPAIIYARDKRRRRTPARSSWSSSS